MQRPLVQHAQRAVHHAGNQTLDEEAAAEEAHQVPHRVVLAEGHQRAEIPVCVGQQGLAAQPALDLTHHMRGLLVRGLCARRHRGGLALARTSGAVADCEDVGIARGLQCWLDDELVDAVDLEPVEVSQYLRGFDAGRPHHQFRGNKRAVG